MDNFFKWKVTDSDRIFLSHSLFEIMKLELGMYWCYDTILYLLYIETHSQGNESQMKSEVSAFPKRFLILI